MKKKTPIKAKWALALWIGCIFTAVWLVFSVVITWCTAKTMDRYLEKENGQIASNIINAAQLQRLANDPKIQEDTKDYWIWDGVNSDWLNNSFGGGLLRHTNHEPQTAVVLYDGEGNLLEKNENAFYVRYITEENWYTQESDMDYDGVAKTLYDPSWITKTEVSVIQRTDWIAMRFTGTLEGGYLTASKIEYISDDTYRDIAVSRYPDGSYERHQRIQDMEQRYGLTWETLMVSSYDAKDQQVYYTLSGDASLYPPGDSLVIDNVHYNDLMDYVLSIQDVSAYNDYYQNKQGNLMDTLITDSWMVYREEKEDFIPAYKVVAAVRYSPLEIAVDSLLYVYIGLFLLLMSGAALLWGMLIRNLVSPIEAFNEAAEQSWGVLHNKQGYESQWYEVQQFRDNYYKTRTEIGKGKDELSRVTAALQYAQEAEINRRQMTSHIAHELKTPIAIIHSYAEGLKEHIAEDKRDKYIDVILSEVERTDNMVLEMLDLSRLEAGKVKLSRDDFSLIALTKSIFEKLEMVVQAKELQVAFSFPKEFIITADEGRIAQVIENFATNAIKYSPVGGHIQVQIGISRSRTTFRIDNDSEPLSEEALSKVWDTFYRTDEARSGGGTGLGLAIAKNIIELHGGKCSVCNTKTGVAFTFTI